LIHRARTRIGGSESSRGTNATVWVFATQDAADEWFKENDPEGIALRRLVELGLKGKK
jgi:hypothetical protein